MSGVHYLEIVTPNVEATCAVYEGMDKELKFGEPDEAMGMARIATTTGGSSLIGIRKPLAEHDKPTVRAYVEVKDIKSAVKAAEKAGATVAYGPIEQGKHGTFAIVIQDDVQHGLWQR